MTSNNSYSSVYPFPIDLNEDDQHQQHQLFNSKPQPLPLSSSSSSSHLACPLFFNPSVQDQAPYDHQTQPHHFQQDDHQDEPFESDSGLKLCIWKTEGERNYESHHQSENSSAKWMPSKMKMASSDHVDVLNNSVRKLDDQTQQQPLSSPDHSCNSSYNNNTIRVCSDCNTTKTPLWRSGPKGPKSLCNACGIRQRKARRAMAAAAAAAGSVVHTETKLNTKKKVQHNKANRSNNGCVSTAIPQWKNKKRKLISSQCQGRKKKKLCLEELRIILSKHSAFHRVFPQDEKEAAILLMALSYGYVPG